MTAATVSSHDDVRDSVPGTVYLIHFATPFKHARHYIGWSSDLESRLASHRKGSGAKLMAAVVAAGIDWVVARTWEDVDRNFERKLKRGGGATRLCPECGCPRRNRPPYVPKGKRST